MKPETFEHLTSDGFPLACYAWLANSPRAVVQILHGMSEYAACYAHVAKELNQAGFSVYAHDHRGHGKSIPMDWPRGHVADEDSWSTLVSDAHALNALIRKKHPGLPVILLAHSMGSFIGQQLLFEHPGDVDAAALSASNGKPPAISVLGRGVARMERKRVGRRNVSPLLQKLTFGDFNKHFAPTTTEFDWLSRDQEHVRTYIEDPLRGFGVSTQLWTDMLDALAKLTDPANVGRVRSDIPLYLFAGERDPVGGQRGVRRLYESYTTNGIKNIQIKIYPDARHETMNETNREAVIKDLVAWCVSVLDASNRSDHQSAL